MFEFPVLAIVQCILIYLSLVWFLNRNDEIPLLATVFIGYISVYRYWSVASGNDTWVYVLEYNLPPLTNELALQALEYIILGEILLIGSYCANQTAVLTPIQINNSDPRILQWLRPRVLIIGLIFLPIVPLSKNLVIEQLSIGTSLAFGVTAYLYLLPMGLIGIASLIFILWHFKGLQTLSHRLISLLIIVFVYYLTYGPTTRFLFVGWIITGAVIISSSLRPKHRLWLFGIAAILLISLFGIAGALRYINSDNPHLNKAAWERVTTAEDANMLDGMTIVMQVFPERFNYSWGMEHFAVLTRPIPRFLWFDKPVGGYANRIARFSGGSTVGISCTLFGDFYTELGVTGIIVLSWIYGYYFGKLIKATTKFDPIAGILIRAILASAMIPLLRGGDLAGVFGWIGMGFWPCFWVLWTKRRELGITKPKYFFYQPPVVLDKDKTIEQASSTTNNNQKL